MNEAPGLAVVMGGPPAGDCSVGELRTGAATGPIATHHNQFSLYSVLEAFFPITTSDFEKVVVVGMRAPSLRSETASVDFFQWAALASEVNPKDYDIWVLVPDLMDGMQSANGLWSLLSPEYVQDALFHETDIYVLGDSRVRVTTQGSASSRFFIGPA